MAFRIFSNCSRVNTVLHGPADLSAGGCSQRPSTVITAASGATLEAASSCAAAAGAEAGFSGAGAAGFCAGAAAGLEGAVCPHIRVPSSRQTNPYRFIARIPPLGVEVGKYRKRILAQILPIPVLRWPTSAALISRQRRSPAGGSAQLPYFSSVTISEQDKIPS